MTYLTLKSYYLRPSPTTFNLPSARLVTLAPGLRPERRFAPLARGLEICRTRVNCRAGFATVSRRSIRKDSCYKNASFFEKLKELKVNILKLLLNHSYFNLITK